MLLLAVWLILDAARCVLDAQTRSRRLTHPVIREEPVMNTRLSGVPMLRKTLVGCGVALFSALTVLPVQAQVVATLVLRDGQRPSGELVDLNASGFTLRVNGQSRQFPVNDVATVEFVVAAAPAEAKARIDAGQPIVVLRNGQIIEGRLYDIRGTRPLRLTIDTPSGRRDYTSSDVAQIYLHAPRGPAAALAQAVTPSGAITVAGNQPWTSTGMTVARGEHLAFVATGDVMIAEGASSGIGGSPAATNAAVRYPVRGEPVGALIARVGNGTPFAIGLNTDPITMPAAGVLFLGVNDDHFADNSGTCTVTLTRSSATSGSWAPGR
jgi:hypothetical protein